MKAIKSNMRDDTFRVLWCPECDEVWSGQKGDYFYLPDDHIFTCGQCGHEMELVHKVDLTWYISGDELVAIR